jgi:hypothetical protein
LVYLISRAASILPKPPRKPAALIKKLGAWKPGVNSGAVAHKSQIINRLNYGGIGTPALYLAALIEVRKASVL